MNEGPGGPAADPLRFGERMTGVEALMWRLGRHDARYQATMSLVVTLDGPVPVPALLDRLSHLAAAVPRLRDRVRESPLPVVPPTWEPDPSFRAEHHVDEIGGPLWEVAARVVADPFQEGRPPWRVVLASSCPGALVLHLHHAYTDGLGGLRLMAELFDFQPSAAAPEHPDPSPQAVGPAGLEALLRDVEGEILRAVGLWSRAVPWAARTLAAARADPGGVLRATADVASALQIHAGAAAGPASPLLADRSAAVHLAPLDLDLGAIRGRARRVGATVNDVFLAGLLDGLERYHVKHGRVAPSLRVGLPISRRTSDVEMHNQVIGAVIRGPLGGLDFDERARLVHEMVLQGRRQPWASLVEEMAEAAVRMPGVLRLAAGALSSLDVVASNVTGPPAPMWLAGAPVTGMTPVGPRSGSALNATLLSYCDTASIGLNVDPAAVADPGVLVDCLVAAFDDALDG